MSKAEEKTTELMKKAKDFIPDGGYSEKELNLAFFMFIEGYHQAEKDLIKNKHEKSWRLDERLWSGFKDIEEASYQYIYDASNDWAYEIPTWDDVQDAFKAGAEWRENIELTWEDLATLEKLGDDFVKHNQTPMSDEEFYKEVLKRFKNMKDESKR